MKESSIMHRIQLACSGGASRLFRCNSGTAWQGYGPPVRVAQPTMILLNPGDVVIRQAQPLQMGLTTGCSDLIGWTQHSGLAVFTAIEVKSATGRIRPEQSNFLERVRAAGGRAGIARSEDDAKKIITGGG